MGLARRRIDTRTDRTTRCPQEETMPILVAAVVAARRGRRVPTVAVPVGTPPLWRLLVEEIVVAARGALAILRGSRWHHRPW